VIDMHMPNTFNKFAKLFKELLYNRK